MSLYSEVLFWMIGRVVMIFASFIALIVLIISLPHANGVPYGPLIALAACLLMLMLLNVGWVVRGRKVFAQYREAAGLPTKGLGFRRRDDDRGGRRR